ncbi:MAG: hypothetical protein QOJ65_1420 [Fimbriimonadaceae bacterium]|jgi:hypothetical protein|nr:hypothetical protein [Fimbriimonadaceae bacterium]
MVSVLAQEANAPWAVGRYGYFVDKYPHDKICLPNYAAHHPDYLHETTMHEYAHAIVLNLAEGHVPRWLNEAIAMVAQGGADKEIAHKFARREIDWLAPNQLNVELVSELEGEERTSLWYAYQQSAWIGEYLVNLKGEAGLAELLKAFADNPFLKELFMRAVNYPHAEEALKQVYGFGQDVLFERALKWLEDGGVSAS